jgi:hypothetical protein
MTTSINPEELQGLVERHIALLIGHALNCETEGLPEVANEFREAADTLESLAAEVGRLTPLDELIHDELFDASTSPPTDKSDDYFEAWQAGYDAALNRVLERHDDFARKALSGGSL